RKKLGNPSVDKADPRVGLAKYWVFPAFSRSHALGNAYRGGTILPPAGGSVWRAGVRGRRAGAVGGGFQIGANGVGADDASASSEAEVGFQAGRSAGDGGYWSNCQSGSDSSA